MIRILVISLVVANLLLLGFEASKPSPEPETVTELTAAEESDVPTIHLFSEMMQDQGLLLHNRQCFSLGPFHSEEDLKEVRGRLVEVSASISQRETQALVEKGYWVFMPPYQSLLEANQALFSLRALGLDDIGIIYDGQWQNAISLGYFLRHENALRRKKGLEDRGYSPMIRVQRSAEPRYWLDYEQNPGSDFITLDMQNRPNDFMQRSLPCPEQGLFDLIEDEAAEELAQGPTNGEMPESESDETNEIITIDNDSMEPGDAEENVTDQGMEIEPESDGESQTGGALN